MSINQQQIEKTRKYIENFFLVYILMQPLLDLSAYIGIPISNPVRVLALLIGFIYLFIHTNKKVKWIGTSYFLLLGLFMLVNFVMNYFIKNPFYLGEELTYNVKSFYVVGILLIYIAVFDSLRKRLNDWDKKVIFYFTINMIFIGIVMLIADLTNSGKRSYGMLVKEGHSGWFFSANELSAILAMGFGFLIIYYFKKKNLKSKFILLPFILLTIWSMLTVGTKVGLGALLMILVVSILICLWGIFRKEKQGINFITLTFILLLTILYIPSSAVGNNLGVTLFPSEPEQLTEPNKVEDGGENDSEIEKKPQIKEITRNALSGRDDFLNEVKSDYEEAPISQKLLGMGQGGNYEEELVIVEMDLHDWFFGYGIIGFILLVGPIVYFGLTTIIRLIKNKFKQLTPSYLILGISLCLGLGTSIVAGHVLLNPASGIYLSILLSYLFIKSAIIPNKD